MGLPGYRREGMLAEIMVKPVLVFREAPKMKKPSGSRQLPNGQRLLDRNLLIFFGVPKGI